MKKLAAALAIVLCCTLRLSAQPPTNGLVSYYPFTGNLNDASGNGIHGTNHGATLTADRNGISGQAYNFSNTALVELIDNGKLNITSNLTIAAWIRSTSISNYQKIITKEELGKGAFRFCYDGANQALALWQGTTLAACASSNNVVPLNEWHFVTVVREGAGTSAGQVKFYVDGLFKSASQVAEAPQSVTHTASISDWDMSPTGHFIGDLDEVCVYNRALSQTEIQQLCVSYTAVTVEQSRPPSLLLMQNYPNPFNPSTTIRYELSNASEVMLEVYDLLGCKVASLINERLDAGVHEVDFDASNLASGMYFYRMQAGPFIATKRFLFLR